MKDAKNTKDTKASSSNTKDTKDTKNQQPHHQLDHKPPATLTNQLNN